MKDTFFKIYALLDARDRLRGALLALMMTGKAALEVLGVGAIPVFVGLLNDPAFVQGHPQLQRLVSALGIETTDQLLVTGGILLIAIFFVKNFYFLALNYLQTRYMARQQVKIAGRLMQTYLQRPYTFHLQHNTAALLRNVHDEVSNLIHRVLAPGFALFMEVMTFLFVVTLLVLVEPAISAAALGLLGASTFLFYKASRSRVSHYGHQEQAHRGKMIQSVQEGLGGIKEAKLLGRESFFLRMFVRHATASTQAHHFRTVLTGSMRPFVEIMAIVGMLFVSGLLFLQGRDTDAIIPVLTLFAVALVRLMPSFNMVLSAVTSLRYYRYAADVVHGDIVEGPEPVEKATTTSTYGNEGVTPLSFQADIELRGIHYTYPSGERQALQGVSLTIPKGSAVAFVGPSGAGKSTIIDVILGLLTPSEGNVLVDGQDIRQDVKVWQQMIGYIPQNIYLSDDTIAHNIAFGIDREDIDYDKVKQVVRAAQLEALVSSLPDGLETFVGEHGIRVSVGQRQRIAIARALYHDPEVLVMDEGTAALDSETERNVIDALERLRGDRTIIMVAHRLSSVKSCDIIYYVKDGEVEARGAYDALLNLSADFRLLASVEE